MWLLGSLTRSLTRARPVSANLRISSRPWRHRPPTLTRHLSSPAAGKHEHEPESETVQPSEHDSRYGFYSVILPEEPFVWGTSHIIPRGVPPQIPRPPYVPDPSDPDEGQRSVMDRRMGTARKLITDPEDLVRLRRSARLAAKVLQYAGTLVQVSLHPIDAVGGAGRFLKMRST